MSKNRPVTGWMWAVVALYAMMFAIMPFIPSEHQVMATAILDLVVFFLCFMSLRSHPVQEKRPASWAWMPLFLFLFIALYYGGQLFGSWINDVTSDAAYSRYTGTLYENTHFWFFMLTMFAAPLCEEYVFRGVIYRALSFYMPSMTAWILQAVLFAVSHLTMVHLMPCFLLGLFNGLVYEWYRKLPYAVAFHMAFNLLSLGVLPAAAWMMSPWFFVTADILLILGMVVLYAYRKNAMEGPGGCGPGPGGPAGIRDRGVSESR